MDKASELAYASWRTRLRLVYSHLAAAGAIWEGCLGEAALCISKDDERLKTFKKMMKIEDEDFFTVKEMSDAFKHLEDSLREMLLKVDVLEDA